MTNADKIRSMSDSELTQFLCNIAFNENGCNGCIATKYCHMHHTGFEDWLKEEYEDSEEDE